MINRFNDYDVLQIEVGKDEPLVISVSELKTLDDEEVFELLSNPWSFIEPFVFPI